ncbi:MAG: glycoside hydrolase family 3 C-terminal domain-containing protein [Cyclobacteriaceae bacterium]|nr:glycoside hydrolase family 3 C-terminal domain-containing protein [Cyclobacteriaceae bacterium]
MNKLLNSAVVILLALMMLSCSTSEKKISSTEQRIDSLISLMTLEEKVGMIHASSSFTSGGVERLGIPEWTMSDGPHGVRKEHGRDWEADQDADDSATYLPTGIALAATWNPDLGYEFGKVLGSEANYRGKDVILGPGINIIRTPVNGRNFEYLSEDPYLISRMAVGYIKGVQDQGVAACVKHYLANNQEHERNLVDVEMSERVLREIYLPGFKAAVQEGGALTLMGSYNKFRGQYCTHHEYLINKILKDEWGFTGAVISDWGAVHNTMEALQYGTDVEMGTDLSMLPNPDYSKFFLADTVIALVKSGVVKESLLDDKVRRILRVMFKTHMFDERPRGAFNTPEHQSTARKIAEEAIVLLKNDQVLPLKKATVKSIAVIGANATRKHAGGGGSSQVNAKYEITPLQGLINTADGKIKINYVPGYAIARDAKADTKLIQEAVKAAAAAQTTIFVGGFIHGYSDAWNDNAYDAEGQDKPNMNLPFGQDELIEALLKANPNTIIVLYGGGPADMTRWAGKAKAIIQAWYPGMEGGTALAKIIFGDINPSGKLPVTFPVKLEDSPAHALGAYPGDANLKEEYKEGLLVGYRYFDTKKVVPQFAFGHGLSYTTFTIENLVIESANKTATVKCIVKNTGNVPGAEVVQVYVKDDVSSVERPEKELKAFQKVFLNPGEAKPIEFVLNEDAFHYYDEKTGQFIVEPGAFTIFVGSSSREITLTGTVDLK